MKEKKGFSLISAFSEKLHTILSIRSPDLLVTEILPLKTNLWQMHEAVKFLLQKFWTRSVLKKMSTRNAVSLFNIYKNFFPNNQL